MKYLNEAASLKSQVIEVRLQDKPGEQKYHQKVKKLFEPHTDKIKSTTKNLTKAITQIYIKNKAIDNLNEKL